MTSHIHLAGLFLPKRLTFQRHWLRTPASINAGIDTDALLTDVLHWCLEDALNLPATYD